MTPIRKGHVGFLLSSGHWQQDDNAFVHATVLAPLTRLAEPFAATVSRPTRVTSGMAQLDFRLFNQFDAQNLPNFSRLLATNGIVTTPVFGTPNQALSGRRLELTIRYGF